MTIRALYNTIIFQFEDAITSKGEFQSKHSIFWLNANFDESAKRPRWGIVLSAGPHCEHVVAGDRVLLPALRWTSSAEYDGQKYWKTDDTQVVIRDRNGELEVLNDYVVFSPNQKKVDTTLTGIVIITNTPATTPTGNIVMTSEAAIVAECQPCTDWRIWYNDVLFENLFVLDGRDLAFIASNEVLCVERIDNAV